MTNESSSPEQNHYQSLLRASELSPASVIITNLKGEIEYVNPKFCEVTGYSQEEVLGQNPRLLKSGEMSDEQYKDLWATISAGGEWHGKFHNRKKNGELYWEQVVITGISLGDGAVTHYLAVKELLTDIKQAELELKKNKARLESIFNNSEVGIGVANREGLYTLVNQRWAEMLGMTMEEVSQHLVADVSYPEDVAESIKNRQMLFDGGIDKYKLEKRFIKKDGSFFWAELSVAPIVEVDGTIREAIGFIVDITERKAMEAKLLASEQLYRSIITASPDNITITDLAGNFRFVSPIALKMFGYESRENFWTGRNLLEFILPEDQGRAKDAIGRVLMHGHYSISEYRAVHRDGSIFPIEVNGEVVRNASGLPEGFVFIVRDVTERRRLEDDQRMRVQELEALHATMQDISSELELPKLLNAIAERLIGLLHAGGCDVALFDEETRELNIVSSYHHRANLIGRPVALGEGILGMAAESQKPLILCETHDWSQVDDDRIYDVIAVPLMTGTDLLGVVAVGTDVIERRLHEGDAHMIELFAQQAAIAVQNAKLFKEVRRLAITDALTGVYNRGYFFEKAQEEFLRCARYPHPMCLVMLDVDHFKEVNDNFGHRTGDQALHMVARLCMELTRDVDLVGRYGGEEFIILLPETPLEGAISTAERLREQINLRRIVSERGEFNVSVSMGVSELKPETRHLDELVERADQAMYRSKKNGRNMVTT